MILFIDMEHNCTFLLYKQIHKNIFIEIVVIYKTGDMLSVLCYNFKVSSIAS